jgi:hypothetical protein
MFENRQPAAAERRGCARRIPLSRDLHQKTSLQALARMSQCCGINELDDKRLAVSRVEPEVELISESEGLPGTSDRKPIKRRPQRQG